jgi:hypothetical protein
MTTETFESKVNAIASAVTRGEDGKLQLPEDLDEAMSFSVRTEIRRRDTQSALSQTTAEKKRLELENQGLTSSWEQDAIASMTSKEAAELEELKHSDPDAWHAKLMATKETRKTEFQARRTKVSADAEQAVTSETRADTLARFNETYEGVLTDDALNNDIPPRLVKNLEEGRVDFEGFLQSCVDFLTKGRVLDKGTEAPTTVDLSKLPGGVSPADSALKETDKQQYSKTEW